MYRSVCRQGHPPTTRHKRRSKKLSSAVRLKEQTQVLRRYGFRGTKQGARDGQCERAIRILGLFV
jgi:hypothetical protein